MALFQRVSDRLVRVQTHISSNELKRSVIKSTSAEEVRPPYKHVRRIAEATSSVPHEGNRKLGPNKVFQYLFDRLSINDCWAVTCKTLLVYHVLLEEGGAFFQELLLENPGLFLWGAARLREPNFVYFDFAQRFATYLQEKVIAYRTLGSAYDRVSTESGTRRRNPSASWQGPDRGSMGVAGPRLAPAGPSWPGQAMATGSTATAPPRIPIGDMDRLDVRQVLQVLPVLETQLEALVDAQLSDNARHNDVTSAVEERVVSDLLPLFRQVTTGISRMLEVFYTLETDHAIRCLHIYERYVRLAPRAQQLLRTVSMISRWGSEVYEELAHAPLDYASGMRQHIMGQDVVVPSFEEQERDRKQEEDALRQAIAESIREAQEEMRAASAAADAGATEPKPDPQRQAPSATSAAMDAVTVAARSSSANEQPAPSSPAAAGNRQEESEASVPAAAKPNASQEPPQVQALSLADVYFGEADVAPTPPMQPSVSGAPRQRGGKKKRLPAPIQPRTDVPVTTRDIRLRAKRDAASRDIARFGGSAVGTAALESATPYPPPAPWAPEWPPQQHFGMPWPPPPPPTSPPPSYYLPHAAPPDSHYPPPPPFWPPPLPPPPALPPWPQAPEWNYAALPPPPPDSPPDPDAQRSRS